MPGEPVMVERNDYARGLWNGDSGLVLRGVDVREGKQRFMAVFRAGETFRAFHLDGLRGALSLAHAITVHKSQGSELDRVGLLLPARDVPCSPGSCSIPRSPARDVPRRLSARGRCSSWARGARWAASRASANSWPGRASPRSVPPRLPCAPSGPRALLNAGDPP